MVVLLILPLFCRFAQRLQSEANKGESKNEVKLAAVGVMVETDLKNNSKLKLLFFQMRQRNV